jgi:hypothetical protein
MNFQMSYHLKMTPEDMEEGNPILAALMEDDDLLRMATLIVRSVLTIEKWRAGNSGRQWEKAVEVRIKMTLVERILAYGVR